MSKKRMYRLCLIVVFAICLMSQGCFSDSEVTEISQMMAQPVGDVPVGALLFMMTLINFILIIASRD